MEKKTKTLVVRPSYCERLDRLRYVLSDDPDHRLSFVDTCHRVLAMSLETLEKRYSDRLTTPEE